MQTRQWWWYPPLHTTTPHNSPEADSWVFEMQKGKLIEIYS